MPLLHAHPNTFPWPTNQLLLFPRRIEPLQSGAWDVIMIPEGGADNKKVKDDTGFKMNDNTQVYGDYNIPLLRIPGSLLINQDSMECQRGFEHYWDVMLVLRIDGWNHPYIYK